MRCDNGTVQSMNVSAISKVKLLVLQAVHAANERGRLRFDKRVRTRASGQAGDPVGYEGRQVPAKRGPSVALLRAGRGLALLALPGRGRSLGVVVLPRGPGTTCTILRGGTVHDCSASLSKLHLAKI